MTIGKVSKEDSYILESTVHLSSHIPASRGHSHPGGIQLSVICFPCRSTIRALIKNFSIASFFPAFITLLFFQHNRTAYDIVAGTIVVKRNGVR